MSSDDKTWSSDCKIKPGNAQFIDKAYKREN